ncbi:hypothetical protein K2P97_06125 [bacterium]|nr:hypothetical protein [bacterium]
MNSVFALLVSSVVAFSAQAALRIVNPEEFQFVHCTPVSVSDKALVKHYVVDIRNERQHKLYSMIATQDSKAKNLRNLRLIDNRLLVNTITTVDVSWISARNGLRFELNILDNGGYAMDGTLTQNGVSTPVSCIDSSLE